MAKSNLIHCQQNLINYQKLRVGKRNILLPVRERVMVTYKIKNLGAGETLHCSNLLDSLIREGGGRSDI